MSHTVLGFHRRLQRRNLWTGIFDRFLETSFLLSSTAAVLLLADRLTFELGFSKPTVSTPWGVLAVLGSALLFAFVFAFAASNRRPPSPTLSAWAADRAIHGDGLFLSAVELAGQHPAVPFGTLVVQQAEQRIRGLSPHQVLPAPRVRHRWATLLALVAGISLILLPPRLYPVPSSRFTAEPVRGNAPLEVFFHEACVGFIDSYSWDLGDGTSSDAWAVSHTYEKVGRYTVSLTVGGPGGEATAEPKTIEVLEPHQVVADFVPLPEKGRSPLTVQFQNLSKGATKYAWTFGDGAFSKEREPTHQFSSPGRMTVMLEVEHQGTFDRVEREIVVIGPNAPLAEFAAFPTKGRAPLTVYFDNRSTGEIENYEWDFGDPLNPSSTEVQPAHTYLLPGTYTVGLRATGPGGEDREVKEHYIRVEDKGGSGGGGNGGREIAPLLGNPAARPRVNPIPEIVQAPGTGPMVEKIKWVYTGAEGASRGGEEPVDQVFARYQRAAEEAITREPVPEPLRDLVREYFEAIRPK